MTHKRGIPIKQELLGDVVPDWFKVRSDGCSVPFKKHPILGIPVKVFLIPELVRAACYIHDWDYYLTGLKNVTGSPGFIGDRLAADVRLKRNIKLVVRLGPVSGWLLRRTYFRAVRIGGSHAIWTWEEGLPWPPSVYDARELQRRLPLHSLGWKRVQEWIGAIGKPEDG